VGDLRDLCGGYVGLAWRICRPELHRQISWWRIGRKLFHFLAVTSAGGTKASDQRYVAIAPAIAKPAIPFAAKHSCGAARPDVPFVAK
jgi:hypothetical protein